MINCRPLAWLLAVASFAWFSPSALGDPDSRAGASIVTLDVARKQYDFRQPWNTRTRSTAKTGIVVGPREILTTADQLFDRTLVRLQKTGAGQWWSGEVVWIDYYANLALVSSDSAEFWRGLTAMKFGKADKSRNWQIARWRQGNLEVRRAEFTAFTVRLGELSDVNHVTIGCDSDIVGLGGGEPIMANNRCIGIVTSQSGRSCVALPSSLLEFVLESKRRNDYRGLGYFHFIWQPAINTDSLLKFGLTGSPRGVIVIDVPSRGDNVEEVVKKGDILLKVDGFEVDTSGNYRDPEFGMVLLENLSTRARSAGDSVPLEVWRDGQKVDVSYVLPKYEYSLAAVPAARFDREPEYLIAGGLVFQPLDREYLETWGADWRKNAPFRLTYYYGQPAGERESMVLLTQVLPDPYNIGYQDQRFLVVDKINGQRITRIQHVQEALKAPVDGFHLFEFVKGDSLRKLVLRAGGADTEATARVLKRYGIPAASRVAFPIVTRPVQ